MTAAGTPFQQPRYLDALRRRGSRLGEPFHYFTQTTSTNDEALQAARRGAPHGALFLAEEQTAGRGRRGRRWFAPPGQSLLFSALLRPRLAASELTTLTLTAGLAVREALSRCCGLELAIKWPNDIEHRRRKLAGILVQAELGRAQPAVVIGVGINVGRFEVPPELGALATSLERCAGVRPEREALLVEVVSALGDWVERHQREGFARIQPELQQHDALLGCDVQVEALSGVARGIDALGQLRVETDTGIVPLQTGTVRRR